MDIYKHRVARRKGGSNTKHSVVVVDKNRTHSFQKSIILNFVKLYKKTCVAALIKYPSGSYSYVLSAFGLEAGMFLKTIFVPEIFSTKYAFGYLVLLKYLPPHTLVFNLEVKVPFGGVYSLAGGTSSIVLFSDTFTNQVLTQLPSGEKILINAYCSGVLGRASNLENNLSTVGKAGLNRNYNLRPTVRGVAKNPVDHPHGGRSKTNKPEKTPWNKIAKKNK